MPRASSGNQPLDRYRSMRDRTRTPEPVPDAADDMSADLRTDHTGDDHELLLVGLDALADPLPDCFNLALHPLEHAVLPFGPFANAELVSVLARRQRRPVRTGEPTP